MTRAGRDRIRRRAVARRLAPVAVLGTLTAALLSGCGAGANGASTVAKAVAPPALSATTPPDGVPDSHAVEPVVGETGPAIDTTLPEDEPASAPRTPPASHSSGAILTAADRASFEHLAASLSGEQGLAVSALGLDRRVERVGTIRTAVAWSTSKVPVAMAVIAAGGEAAQQANLRRAITASDNAAAERLWGSLGGGRSAAAAAEQQLRGAGDARTSVEYRALRGAGYTPFGQTSWALTDQARFAAGLACSRAGQEVLGLMGQVVPGQRWGLGSAGVDAQFKGGWGPGSAPGAGGGYLDRQLGVVTIHGKPLAVAVATRPADGSHETGTRNLTAIARWLVAHADASALPADPHC